MQYTILIKALPVETPTTLPKPSKITRSYTYTSFQTSSTVSGLNKPSPSHSESLLLIKVMLISLRTQSNSIMPVTCTGQDLQQRHLNLSDLKSYNSPAELHHSCREMFKSMPQSVRSNQIKQHLKQARHTEVTF